jgi:hypothetical protein
MICQLNDEFRSLLNRHLSRRWQPWDPDQTSLVVADDGQTLAPSPRDLAVDQQVLQPGAPRRAQWSIPVAGFPRPDAKTSTVGREKHRRVGPMRAPNNFPAHRRREPNDPRDESIAKGIRGGAVGLEPDVVAPPRRRDLV